MISEKVDLSRLRSDNVLIIFDLDRVAYTEFTSLHKENVLGSELHALKVKGTLYNTSILYGVLEQMVKRPFNTTDYLFATDTREGFLSWLYARFEYGGLPNPEQEFYSQLNWLRYLLKEMNFNLMEQDGYEAYNFVYMAVQENYDSYDKIIIFSDDVVLYPLVDSKVSVLSTEETAPDVTVGTYETVLDAPYNLLQLKQCTVGDKTLGLKGISRFGVKKFETLLIKDAIFEKPLSKSTAELIEESDFLDSVQKEEALSDLKWLLPREGIECSTRPLKATAIDVKSLLHKLDFLDLLEKAEQL